MTTTKPKNKILRGILAAILAIVLVAGIVIWTTFGNLVLTLFSIERVGETQLFTMEYKGDYGFDKFLETGASSDGELVQFVVSELTHGIPLEFELPDLGCSTFVASTEEGDHLFGRNFDMYYSPVMLTKTTPDNGYRSVTMVNLAYIGYNKEHLPTDLGSSVITLCAPYAPMDGMNEKGLAVSVMLIDTVPTNQNTEKTDITTSSAIRLLLDKCATVEEAIETLQNYDMHASANSCYHFMVADASGDSVVIEYIDDEISILRGEKVSTNFLLTPGDYDFGGGYERYDVVTEALEEADHVLSEEEAMGVLEACSQNGEKSQTQWSCVYNLDKLTVDVVVGMDYENVYSYSILD
ncbi:MAG: linear amide C-N hydrolase [Oscillospiraceae bacterium]|nr:linear amide C-N hydrolase [Oscillospiraceae bacterium]